MAYEKAHRLPTNHPRRTLLQEPCRHRLKRPSWRSMAKTLTSRLPDALSSRDAPQTLLECPWAAKGQWKVFPEGKLAPTDPPPTGETCLQTVRLLDPSPMPPRDPSSSGRLQIHHRRIRGQRKCMLGSPGPRIALPLATPCVPFAKRSRRRSNTGYGGAPGSMQLGKKYLEVLLNPSRSLPPTL